MNSLVKKLGTGAAMASSLFALGAVAQAQTITVVGVAQVGNNFQASYGKDGYVLLATTAKGTNYKTANPPITTGDLSNANFTSNDGANDPLTASGSPTVDGQGRTIVNPSTYAPNGSAPGYATLKDSGIVGAVNNYIEAGNNYDAITPTLEAGFGGTLNGGGTFNVLQFTLTGSNVPTTITFGVLSDFTGPNTGPLRQGQNTNEPGFIQLNGPNGSTGQITDKGVTGSVDNLYLFTINQAAAGQVFTLALNAPAGSGSAIYSGVTFDSVAAPEPSSYAALGLGVLGLSLLTVKARRRTALNA